MPRINVEEFEIEEAMEYMAKDSESFKFKLAEIYIPIYTANNKSNKNEVEKLVLKLENDIRNKGNFIEIVRQFSRSRTASKDGQLGWVNEKLLNDAILKELKQTSKNDITKPIFIGNETSGGFYIFQLQDLKKEININEQTKRSIENFTYMNKVNVESKQYLSNLYEDTFIEFSAEY